MNNNFQFDNHDLLRCKEKNKIFGFIGGWNRRVSVSVETSIGLAVSEDQGNTFNRINTGPVLTSSLNEPFLVGDPFVSIFNDVYHMWYIYGLRWIEHSLEKDLQRVYKIGHAISEDGIVWKKSGRQIVADKLNSNECQALPTVIHYNGRYHMYFCYREVAGFRQYREKAYRIGYAYSNDLTSWIRSDARAGIDVSKNGWDSEMQCYPHIFHCNGKVFLLYNGNHFGRYGFGLAELIDD